ncbi:probable G-protein coupled receptor 179 isoform X1 [Anolis carolinensis]|uniref:probable G-protein coupled receptor 179 isoform X1 n=1 Tax=Anolis carolinensis TaxID=28377 RepID=UPI002F2B7D18
MEICLLGFVIWCFHLETLWAAGLFQYQRSAPPKARTPKMKVWMPSSSPSLASTFTWVPTPNLDKTDLEGSEAAVAFLYSGDVLSLLQANCTRKFEVRDMEKASSPPPALRSYLRGATDTLTHATNFLNMVFQTNDIRESSVKEDVEWYHALVRSVIEGDSQVYRAMLTFDAHPVSSKPQMMLQATKENNEILLQDLSPSAESLRNLTWENEWYNFFRFQRAPFLYKRILSNDLKTLDTPKWSQGDSYVMDTGHVRWSPPFLECEDGKFWPTWMVTLSSSFYGLKPDLNPEFKGVLRMDVKIQNIDINQCASGQGWFANTHQCDLNSTQCIPQENQGFVLGKYLCICKPGFYGASRSSTSSSSSPDSTNKDQTGERVSQYGTTDSGNLLECRPCQEGCTTCIDDTPCLIQEDWSLRAAVLAFQAFCMLAVFFSMLVSYHFRKSKRIRASGVLLLETILFGSLLLYFPVFILYFKPSIFRCIVLRWVRMLGFAIVYGTITLKLYRVLKIFLSRTAQRVPYMSSGRVLKMLALILLLVLWFLAAWTVGMLENIGKNIPLVVLSQTTRGLQFYICDHDRWDYMMVVAEMLFLFWGSFLCYATRTVPSAFHEPRYMGIALHNELITSAAFHVIRFLMVPSLHPDWTLLIFFIHTHVTTTMTLALLFIPKFLHAGSPLKEEIAAEVYEDELDMRHSGSYLNSSITSAWSEHSLDPDDIRDELKKLYTQLEVHKTKKMTANNPHLQKKRSSKRSLGRSLMRRITEIPDSVSRQCSKEEKDGSVGGGTMSRAGSYKQRHLDTGSSSMKRRDDSSSKHKVSSSLKKSHSTYDHTRDAKENSLPSRHNSCKEAPLLDSMMRKKLAKKASERSNNDSLDDSAPLVYKSASAHNLMAERKPLHPKPSPLQKSLSVVTSAKEKALLLTNRAYLEESSKLAQDKERKAAAEDSTTGSEVSGYTEIIDVASEVEVKQLDMDDPSAGTVSSLLESDHGSKDVVCPWESATTPSTPSESRFQKHVTYASMRSASINTSELTARRHHASKKIPPEPPIRQQSLVHSLEKKDVVHGNVDDQKQPSFQSPKTDLKDSPVPASLSPTEIEKSPEQTKMEKTRDDESIAPVSSSTGLTRLASIAAEVCPWEVMEMPLPKKKDSDTSESDSQKSSPEKQPQSLQTSIPKSSMKSLGLAIKAFNRSRIKGGLKARKDSEENQRNDEKDMDGKSEKPLGESPGPQVISRTTKAKVVSKQATICPWDEEEEEEVLLSSQKHSPSKTPEVCPWEESPDVLVKSSASSAEAIASKNAGEISRIRLEKAKSTRESLCPWEFIDEDQKKEDKTSNISLDSSRPDGKKAEACPWEVEEVVTSTRSDTHSMGVSSALSQDEAIKESKVKHFDGYKRERSSTKVHPSETQEKVSAQQESKSIKEPSLRKEIKKSSEVPNVDEKKLKNIGKSKTILPESEEVRVKSQICPWEVEEALKKTPEEDSAESSKEEKSIASKAAAVNKNEEESICPWEAMKLPGRPDTKTTTAQGESSNKATVKICPWEASDILPEKLKEDSVENSRGTESRKLRSPLSEQSKDKENSHQGYVCPWENVDVEGSSAKPAVKVPKLSEAVLKPSGSGDSKKADVCPWETEATSSTLGKATKQVEGGPSKGTPMRASHISKTSICPWEETDSEDALLTPGSQSLNVSDIHSKKPDGFQSKRAEIAPWEMQEETEIKATICPWESDDSLTQRGFKRDASVLSKEERKEIRDAAQEKGSNSKRESICPWESTDSGDSFIKPKLESIYLSKGRSKKSDSVESQRSSVCPWETEGTEVGTKTAEICLWEEISTPSATRLTRQETKKARDTVYTALEKESSPQESVCPWETMDTDYPSSRLSTKSPSMSKVSSKKSSNIESLKAEVCSWKSQEAESSPKADVCPWEVSESQMTSLKPAGDIESHRHPPVKQTGSSKTMEKKTSLQESVCPWDSVSELPAKPERPRISSKKSDSADSLKAEICPWEVEENVFKKGDDGSSFKGLDSRSTSPMNISEAMEKLSRSRDTICPWESMELEESSAKSAGQSPALSKTGSKKSDSAESLRAEVCPWEAVEEEEGTSAVDICPWTAATAPFEKGKLGQSLVGISKGKRGQVPLRSPDSTQAEKEASFKKIEKSKSQQEPAFAWKSMEFDKPPAKSTRSLDLLQVSSKKSESVESLKAEICPWDFQELETESKVETFQRVAAERPSEKTALQIDRERVSSKETSTTPMTKHLKIDDKVSSSRESICPWESMELPSSPSPTLSKTGSKKSDSAESLRAEVCPWETKEEECPTEVSLVDKETLRKKTSLGKISLGGGETLSKKVEKTRSHPGLAYSQKNNEELSIKPISKSLDLFKVDSAKSDSCESLKAEVCPWETQEITAVDKGEGCLWEVAGAPLGKGILSKDKAGIFKRATKAGSTGPEKTFKAAEEARSPRESICPWESSAAAEASGTSSSASASAKKSDSTESRKAEVCPWETDHSEADPKAEICPWEVGPVMAPKDERHITHTDRTEMPTVSMKRSQSKQEGLAAHKPLCRSLPATTQTKSLSTGSSPPMGISPKDESAVADVCPWEIEDPSSTRKQTVKISKTFAEVNPREAEGISSTSAAKSKTEKSQTDSVEGPSQAKSDICPWDCD